MSTNEQTQWRKFLQPLVTGLVALVAALTLYVQRSDNDRTESRLTALEVQTESMQPWRHRVDSEMDNFKSMLSDIRSDVSFIRGKLESAKDK